MGTMAVNQIRVKLYELSPTFEWVDKGCGTIGLVKPPSTDTDTYTTADASDVNIGTDSNDAVDTSGTTGLSDANVVVDSAVEAGVEGVAASIEIEDSKQSVVNVIVWSEVEEDVKLLETVVYKDTEFKIQQDTLLLFQCTTDGIDKALSFQEAESCEDTLARIHMMQGHTPSLSSSWADMSDAEDRRAIMTLPGMQNPSLDNNVF
ncbi:hypothetical protein SARC_01650 [Sphaeroforma arctica JP610]|uniref:PP4R3 EVH1-like domain-containing protein n=1 Tax=Sphaeroforma arctica JP610 TaxID=667725 RepID=A0A0L0GAY4_9EUKA|nr:hypothetical protein SARC_01650 [Sphaeroforma arctica JP610]KNC86172.1 hypothetical protein SARC_01650 [Sphaeroforma arctica JP610]|eukprot:XP_014160074.1 hypothetical protein SARC_01650 [Sphaeroforma arctica JP610]